MSEPPSLLRSPVRTLVCLGVGTGLWAQLGAVEGARYWQVSAAPYLLGLAAAGAAFGLAWRGRHLQTGLVLVAPGVVWLAVRGVTVQAEVLWWWVTVLIGSYLAGSSHWLLSELRRALAAVRWPRRPVPARGTPTSGPTGATGATGATG